MNYWHTWETRDPELTSPYGDNNPPAGYADKPKTWGDMTDEEKGALLLAEHEGSQVQIYIDSDWVDVTTGRSDYFVNDQRYRIKPEPKRETVTMYSGDGRSWHSANFTTDTHRITFDLIDGEPDTSSIRMEKI